jgi:hypothetical protein
VLVGLSNHYHFPSGHFSVAMRSFAHVEHPHLRQRPVPLRAAESHSEQAWQVDSRAVRISGVVVENPDVENFHADLTASIAMIFGFIKNIKNLEI